MNNQKNDTVIILDTETGIKSPYIKTHNKNIEEMRLDIAKSNTSPKPSLDNKNTLSINLPDMPNGLKKATNILVGMEIKKICRQLEGIVRSELKDFKAEIIKNLDDKISGVENNFLETLKFNKKITDKSLTDTNKNFEDTLLSFNQKITEFENRLNVLKIYSEENNTNLTNIANSENKPEDIEIFKTNLKNELKNEKEIKVNITEIETDNKPILLSTVLFAESINHHNLYADSGQEQYVEKKLKDIENSFLNKGLLFKKNIYHLYIKNSKVKEILENGENDFGLDKKSRIKICKIINDLKQNLNLTIQEDGTVHGFLGESFKKEYLVIKNGQTKEKFDLLTKFIEKIVC